MDKAHPLRSPLQRAMLIFISALWLFLLTISRTPLGVFSYIFFNIPLILLYLCYGEQPSRGVFMVAAFSLAPALVLKETLLPAVEAGMMAVVMGEAIRRRFTAGRTVLMGSMVSLLVAVVVLPAAMAGSDAPLSEHFQDMAGSYFRGNAPFTKGLTDERASVKEAVERTVKIMARLFPGILVSSSVFSAFIGYWASRRFWRRLRGDIYFDPQPLSLWSSPEWMVWILIAGGLLAFTPLQWLKSAGYNIIVPLTLIYFLQGMAIMAFHLQKRNLPGLLQGVIYVPVLVYPLFWPLVASLGLFDLWADFRQLRAKKSTS